MRVHWTLNWQNILRVCIEICSEKESLGQKGNCSICDDSEDKIEAMARGRLALLDPNRLHGTQTKDKQVV